MAKIQQKAATGKSARRYHTEDELFRAVRAWARARLRRLKWNKRRLQWLRAQAHASKLVFPSPRRGRQQWEPRTMFVRNVNQKWGAGERDPAQALDDMVALSIVAGLVKPADFTSIMAQAARSQKRPTLANGLEVERKRIRKLWPQLLKGYRPELPDRRRN